jgi:hypothetical protein
MFGLLYATLEECHQNASRCHSVGRQWDNSVVS